MITTLQAGSTPVPTLPAPRAPGSASIPAQVDSVQISVRSPFEPTVRPTLVTTGMAPPSTQPAAEAPQTATRLGWKGILVGVMAAAAVAGAVGVIAGHGSAPAPESPVVSQVVVPSNLTAEDAKTAFDDLRFLNTVGFRSGGGLSRPVHGIFSQRVTPQEALDDIAQGKEVTFKARGGSERIHSVKELREVRERVAQQQVEQILGPGTAR